MAKEKESIRRQNTAHIVGYLKENNLECVTNKNNEQVIRGSVIIATDEVNSHKVQFYVPATTKDGNESKDFETLTTLLPENTISIASFLKSTPQANFATAANASTKIWIMGRFEEYVTREGERENSSMLIKGFKAGLQKATDSVEFNPRAEFTCDVYIAEMTPEVETVDEVEKETGRIIIKGLVPLYDGSVNKMEFVAPVEDGIADYIKANYKPTDTVTLKGNLINISYREEKEIDTGSFGKGNDIQYISHFTRERKIYGGSKVAIHEGEEGSITTKEVKEGLAKRESKIKTPASKVRPQVAQPKTELVTPEVDDLDF